MRDVSGEMWLTWENGQFLGDNRPITRATISKTVLETFPGGRFRSLLFGSPVDEVEIYNIKTCAIDRRIGTDAARMTMTLLNAEQVDVTEDLDVSYLREGTGYPGEEDEENWDPLYPPYGDIDSVTKRDLKEFGTPGKYTYRRGVVDTSTGIPNPWMHYPDPTWVDMFIPNRVIKTFQGYGTDSSGYPWNDTKLTQTGVWLIDKVETDVNGTITLTCRDMAKLLIEQRLYPPIIPLESYQLNICGPYKKTTVEESTSTTSTPEAIGPNIAVQSTRTFDSSTAYYSISTYGHITAHAFDGDETTYWVSMRNSQPSYDWSYEWVDAWCKGEPISRVRFKPWKGGYTCYVGVQVDGVWQGTSTVPYNRYAKPAAPNDSDIKYLKKVIVQPNEDWVSVDLDEVYNADYVRLVFTDLQDFSGVSGRQDGDYRAGVYEFECMAYTAATSTTTTTEEEVVTNEDGNISDYTDIIKLFLAWSGFYWPRGRAETELDPFFTSYGSDPLFLRDDWGAEGGRVWGDFMDSGAYPIEPPCIDPAYWDNKSVQDGINQIKEILGFIGYVDSTGGYVWRPPNIWKTGNFVSGKGYIGRDSVPIITEDNVLLDYGVTIDDASLRSEIVVVSKNPNPDGSLAYGSFVPDYVDEDAPSTIEGGQDGAFSDVALLAGQVRTMLVADYPFGQDLDDAERAREEVNKFAYLVALWIHWSYRKSKFRIPGMPALEPDDQVQIYERITSDTYIHYLLGVNSVMDMDAGTWYMDIDTHWLGHGPDSQWHVKVSDMSPSLFAYLKDAGYISDDIDPSAYPEDWYKYSAPEPPADLPRVADDYEWLFPSLPAVVWPPGLDWGGESIDLDDGWITNPNETGSGGSVLNCSNGHAFSFWPGAGPRSKSARPPNCSGHYHVRKWFWGASGSGSHAVVDSRAWPVFRALCQIMTDEGYVVSTASGFNCRYVKGTSTWSNHAWALAVDINSGANPWGTATTNSTLLRVGQRAEGIRVKDSAGLWIPAMKWGQFFKKPDPMHFQVCCGPEDIARGIKVPGIAGPT